MWGFCRGSLAPLRRRQRRKHDRHFRLKTKKSRQRRTEFLPAARVAPRTLVMMEMEAAGSSRDPNLTVRNVPVDDQLAAGTAIDAEHAIVKRPVQVRVGAVDRRIQRCSDRRQYTVGERDEFAFTRHWRSARPGFTLDEPRSEAPSARHSF
jgi:hypothetical protein